MESGGGIAARFTWHPEYANRTLFDVRQELVDDISADQRAYEMAMDAAETKESDVLAAIMGLDKKWSEYNMGWAEADPGEARGPYPGVALGTGEAARVDPICGVPVPGAIARAPTSTRPRGFPF